MADERPVCEVLCDAMEYLCKLGSNLRSRSENLKEKKIKRDKLNNAHAVQKAANKVLMICELSKKSLENVETGVKRILSIVDASQANDGAKSSKFKDDKHKYQYFYVGSHKVKISRKVPLKHYTSVKVLAKSMPTSMQDKYPVYHNCKLYRQRKRNIQESEDVELQITSNSSESKEHAIDNELNLQVKASGLINCFDNEESTQLNTELNEDKLKEEDDVLKVQVSSSSKKLRNIEIVDSSSDESKKETCKKYLQVNGSKCIADEAIKELDKSESQIIKYNNGEKLDKLTELDDKKKELNVNEFENKELETVDSKSNDNDQSSDSDHSESLSKKPLIKCVNINKLLKPNIIHNKQDSSSKKVKKKEKEAGVNSVSFKGSSENSLTICRKSEEYWEGKRKEVSAFKPKTFVIKVSRLPKFSITYLNEHNLKRITHNGLSICQVTSYSRHEDSAGSNKTVSENNIEKCQKLDAKSALLTDSDSDSKAQLSKSNKKSKSVQLSDSDSNKKEESSLPKDSQDDSHNIKKSKTALLFDSDSDKAEGDKASFSKCSNDESNKNKKSKSALLSDSDSDKAEKDTSFPKDLTEDTNKIKKSLLNESDSDQGDERDKNLENKSNDKCTENGKSNKEQIHAKNMLLNESDSEEEKGSEKPDECDEQSNVKDALHYESDSETAELKNPTEGNDNTISSSVECQGSPSRCLKENLNDNLSQKSEETPKTPNNKRKRLSSDTPRSKRKNIMRSMRAKKMLLTYSSSDTEDEQLKNALKEIKESVQRGISSDEENDSKTSKEKRHKRKIYTSSDSGEDDKNKEPEERPTNAEDENTEKDNAKESSSIDQIDGNMDELSNSSSSKVRPKKTKK